MCAYVLGLESLPTELERNFKLMRKLDDRAQTAMKSIDGLAKEFMTKLAEGTATMNEEERKRRLSDIQQLFGKAKEYSDDKVQLAIQTYELVDKQIRRLDNDLARFEGEIQEKALLAAAAGSGKVSSGGSGGTGTGAGGNGKAGTGKATGGGVHVGKNDDQQSKSDYSDLISP